MSQVSSDTTEVYRIRIPAPATELVLGKDERGFAGLHLRTDVSRKQFWGLAGAGDVSDTEMELALGEFHSGFKGFSTRVGSGSVFVSAGGGVFGLSRFEEFGKSLSGINLGLGGLMAASGMVEKFRFYSENSYFTLTLTAIKLAAQVTLAGLAIGSNGVPKSPGAVSIYGDTSVSIVAPATVSMTAIGLASLNAGVAAGVSGMVYSSVGGGVLTGVSALISASVTGLKTSMVGDDSATVAARHGEVRLEGKKVLVGVPSFLVKGQVRPRGGIAMAQEATTHVSVEADDEVQLAAGKPPAMPHAPTKLRATSAGLRLESRSAALTLDAKARLFSGLSMAEFGPRAITLARTMTPAKAALDTAVAAAETAYTAAVAAADAARDTAVATDHLIIAGIVGGLVGTITAAATVAGTKTSNVGAVVGGILGGGVAGGAAVGTLGTLAVTKLVKTLAADKARDLAVKAADVTRKVAITAAATLEDVALTAGTINPISPKIQIKDDRIVMSVGLNKITIDALGVSISAPAGQVKVSALATEVKGVVNQLG